jgi:hypothetical protein
VAGEGRARWAGRATQVRRLGKAGRQGKGVRQADRHGGTGWARQADKERKTRQGKLVQGRQSKAW